jgi:hypothetical protein
MCDGDVNVQMICQTQGKSGRGLQLLVMPLENKCSCNPITW